MTSTASRAAIGSEFYLHENVLMTTIDELILERLDRIEALLVCKADSFLTEDQAAAILQISSSYLKRLRLDGQITSIPIGGGDSRSGVVRYTRHDLDSFARRHRK